MPSKRARVKQESLPEKWQRLSAEHEKAGALLREVVIARLEEVKDALDAGEKVWHSEIRALGETLVRAIEIERQAVSMEYQDSNRAVQRVQQLGFLVSRDDGAIEVDAEYVHEKTAPE